MDRLSTSTSQRDNTRMQNNLADVATFEVTGSRGTAKYKLKDELHVQVDPFFEQFMWIEQQQSEEGLQKFLQRKGWTLSQWSTSSPSEPLSHCRRSAR
jgi:hypothetical protein